jgi:hypothetical protein
MTEWYTHFNTADLSEVRQVQEGLFIANGAARRVDTATELQDESVPVQHVETVPA